MKGEHQPLSSHGTLGPNIVGCKDAELFHGKAFEDAFDILGINILPFFRDDHIFLAAAQLQMTVFVEFPQVSGHQPAINNRFGGELGVVEIAGHNRFAAHGNFPDSVTGGIHDAHFHSGQRFANSVRAKRP